MIKLRKCGSRSHFALDAGRSSIRFGLQTGLLQIMREQRLAFATLVKSDANTKGEQAANEPHNYFHALKLSMNARIFKLEASPC